MKIHLVIVDPQNDFCDSKGTLYVTGGEKDMTKVAEMIDRIGAKLDDVHVTMDSHRLIDISHPSWWKRVGDGAHPGPFTLLGLDGKRIVKLDPKADGSLVPTTEEYTTYLPSFVYRSREYLKALADGKRYPHCIWPPHCLIGTWGHNVYPALADALRRWEDQQFAMTDYVTKGSNPWTEHFSGIKAEVPDPSDPSTQVNTGLIQTLETADLVVVCGEALSHCVANTVRDIGACFSDPKYIEKITLLTDASSNVPGFEHFGKAFLDEMTKKGMRTDTTDNFLK
jgi:nicotinamidase-related amidase